MFRLGILLMLLSCIPWVMIPAVPWMAEEMGARAQLGAGLFVLAEVLFWVGVPLAGKEVLASFRAQGWRRALPELFKKLRAGR